ncbi:hypothetical protein PAXRUDRAFT_148166, partial [Paxillus rubicundulus Ve08.2h10]
KISPDMKHAALQLNCRGLMQLSDILDCVNFSHHTFYHIRKLFHETSDVVNDKNYNRAVIAQTQPLPERGKERLRNPK